jgi:homocitrate synthase NifV
LVLGKHSGTQGVIHAYKQIGIAVSRIQAQKLLTQVRLFVSDTKRTPKTEDLNLFHQNL